MVAGRATMPRVDVAVAAAMGWPPTFCSRGDLRDVSVPLWCLRSLSLGSKVVHVSVVFSLLLSSHESPSFDFRPVACRLLQE